MGLLVKFSKQFALPLWKWYAAGLAALAVTNIITLEIPQLAKLIINAVNEQKVDGSLKYLALALIGLGTATIFIRATSRIFLFLPGRKLEAASRNYLFSRMMRLPQVFYARFGMGDLISRLTNDIGQLRAFYAFGILQLLNLVFLTAFTISKMLSVHVTLTLLCLAPMLIMVFFMKNVFAKLHYMSIASQESLGRLTNKVTEAFVNVHVIQANAAEESFLKRAEKESLDVYQSNINAVVLRTIFFPLLNSLMNVSQVLVVFYGGYEVMHQRLTIGDILAFNVYLAYLSFPLSAFGIIVSLYQRSKAALLRIAEIEGCPLESKNTKPFHPADHIPTLSIRNLKFSYEQGKDTQTFDLKSIDITLKPGMRLGLFGPIGAGKTTLFNLITRLQEPPPKTIFLDNVDVLDIDPQILRTQIGYVQQTVHLFSSSVRENLQFGIGPLDDTRLQKAADEAQVKHDIEAFEHGWDTQIGEKGIRLSGGQKQRLALARFLLRKPPILLLDDVLSAVDKKTEKRMIAELKALPSSVMIASHRTLALKECDEVILLDRGRIVDRGTFDALRKTHQELFEQEYETHAQ